MAAASVTVTNSKESGITTVLPGQTPKGQYILSVLLKRSYDIVPNGLCRRTALDTALISGDVYWDDPMNSSVRYESDFIPFKLATDVVLNGKAYAPKGVPVRSCTVSLGIDNQRVEVLVLGDRSVRFVEDAAPAFSEPSPFLTMDLRYERSYGGIDVSSEKFTSFPYPRNPLGSGFAVTNCAKSTNGLALPNLEQADAQITPELLCLGDFSRWEQQPFPAGLGWFPKTWWPRAQLAGILPADRPVERELREAYAKLVPIAQRDSYLNHGLPDMDFRFFNGASRGLVFPYLRGGEQIVTENVGPEGTLSFRLPDDSPRLGLDIGSDVQEPEVVMHTVMIRMEDRQLDIVWRGAVPYEGPDWLPQMRRMEVSIQ